MAGSDEDEELRHRRLVQQILVRVLALQNDAAIFLDGQKNCFKTEKFYFPNSVLIKLVLPQATQLSIHFLENQWCCTSLWDLIKEAPLGDRVRERERSTLRDSNSLPPD